VLVVGGQDPNGATLASAEVFDPKTGTFAAAGSMKIARWGTPPPCSRTAAS